VATKAPIARLAIACVLEGIGGRYGSWYGQRLAEALHLRKEQVTFYLNHGDTDKVHRDELNGVISTCNLTPEEWAWMAHAAAMAGRLYRAMYDHDAFALT
jgi:hypothetical protein